MAYVIEVFAASKGLVGSAGLGSISHQNGRSL